MSVVLYLGFKSIRVNSEFDVIYSGGSVSDGQKAVDKLPATSGYVRIVRMVNPLSVPVRLPAAFISEAAVERAKAAEAEAQKLAEEAKAREKEEAKKKAAQAAAIEKDKKARLSASKKARAEYRARFGIEPEEKADGPPDESGGGKQGSKPAAQ
jgi:hypothetical protein